MWKKNSDQMLIMKRHVRGVSGVRDGDVTFYTFYRVCHNLQKERKICLIQMIHVLNMKYPNTVICQINYFAIVKIDFITRVLFQC